MNEEILIDNILKLTNIHYTVHLPLIEKIGQLRKKKRALFWSISLLVYGKDLQQSLTDFYFFPFKKLWFGYCLGRDYLRVGSQLIRADEADLPAL